jgi:hypothetical protein
MRRYVALLLCGAAGTMIWNSAPAATGRNPGPTAAKSYAELLEPVPDATAALLADELSRTRQRKASVQLAQYHHHHHHHHFYRHHHHHHHSFFPGFGITIGPPAYYGPDCYWTLSRPFWNGWRWVRRRIRVCD